MRVTGIIAEYNPFHSGHRYQLARARELTGADFCVAAISGDFVQRGEPALFDKYLRARMALACGADLVLELPSLFAAGSAEDFARCGVALFSELGAVDALCFGSEEGELAPLRDAAALLTDENPHFRERMREGLRRGLTWPAARAAAAGDPESARLLSSPNNLLGIEYLRALRYFSSAIEPVTVKREGAAYHDGQIGASQASASAIRAALSRGEIAADGSDPSSWRAHVPEELLPLYDQGLPIRSSDLSLLLNAALLASLRDERPLTQFEGFSKELADRLTGCALQYTDWEGRIRQLKTRQYTYTRVSRALLNLTLGVTAAEVAHAREAGYAPYSRILGFRREAAPLLSELKKRSQLPLITKTAEADKSLAGTARAMLLRDFSNSHLYQVLQSQKYGLCPRNEFNRPLAIV